MSHVELQKILLEIKLKELQSDLLSLPSPISLTYKVTNLLEIV